MESQQELNLEEELKRVKLNNYILEEENSLLRENVQCLLGDLEHLGDLKEEEEKIIKEKREIEKMKSGKIYKILTKMKKFIK